MTVYEIFLGVEDGIDKVSSGASGELTQQQKERLVDHAAERFVKQRYGIINTTNDGFEVTQKRVDDLSSLVEYKTLPVYSPGEINTSKVKTSYYQLPSDYWFSVSERVELIIPECNINEQVKVLARRHNEINTILDDPFNKPEGKEVFRVMKQNKINLFYASNVTVNNLFLAYISAFKRLQVGVTYQRNNPNGPNYWQNVEYWFNPQTHQEIINIAVEIFLEGVQDGRYATYLNQLKTQ